MSSNTQLHNLIFNSSTYPMWIIEKDTMRFLEVNDAALALYGYSRNEFLEMSLKDISVDKDNETLDLYLNNPNPLQSFKHVKKNAMVAVVEIKTIPISVEQQNLLFHVITDISEYSQTINKLKESEENFRSLVENSDDMIMRFDSEFRHLYVNPATEKYLKIKPIDFIGKTHLELGFPEDLCEAWDSKIDKVFKAGQIISELSETNPDGFYFHWDLIPEFDKDGHVKSVLSITRDISDFVRAKKDLEASENKLREINFTKDKVFSIIAHDLRGPISSIDLALNIIASNDDMDPDEKSIFYDELVKTSRNVTVLVENLLNWAMTQLNGIEVKICEIPLNDIIQANVELLTTHAKAKDISIETAMHQPQIMVMADNDSVSLVLRNLISNAVKFTHAGGRIRVATQDEERTIKVIVEDDGVGIKPELLSKLFQDNTFNTTQGTSKETGSGLGLHLCKEFVARNGGKIWVESAMGEGSKFIFTLPKA